MKCDGCSRPPSVFTQSASVCQSDAVVFFFRWSRRVVLSLTLMRFLSLRFWYRHTLKHTSSSLRVQRAAEEDSGWHFQNKADEEEVSSTSDQTSENHHKKQRHYFKGSFKFTDLYLFTFYCNEVKKKRNWFFITLLLLFVGKKQLNLFIQVWVLFSFLHSKSGE